MGKNKDNYYLILDLDFTNPEKYSVKEIGDRIREKLNFWNENCERDRKRGNDYKKYKSWAVDIQNVMTTPALRKREANDAEEFVKEYLAEAMKFYSGQKEIEKKSVEKICEGCNISLELFEKLTERRIVDKIVVEVSDPNPSPKELRRVRKADKALDSIDRKTLYHFLAESDEINLRSMQLMKGSVLIENYSNPIKLRYRNLHTDEATVVRNLCAIAEELFDDAHPEYKEDYDKYLVWKEIDTVIRQMENVAGSQKELDEKKAGLFIKAFAEIVGSMDKAQQLYTDVCRYKKITGTTGTVIHVHNQVLCARCSHYVSVENGERICSDCGADLYMNCPKCGKEVPASSEKCGHCGLSLQKYAQIPDLVSMARKEIRNMNFGRVHGYLDTIEEIWPGYEDATTIRKDLELQETHYEHFQSDYAAYMEKKKYYKAKQYADNAGRQFPGVMFENLDVIEKVLTECDALKKRLLSVHDEANALEICDQIRNLCDDYPIDDLMKVFPPQSVTDFSAVVSEDGKSINLKWNPSASSGEIIYRIFKKAGSLPRNFADADCELERTKDCTIRDFNVKSGIVYYYVIVAERSGTCSRAVRTSTINMSEISGLYILAKNQKIELYWDSVPENAEVIICRKEGGIPVSELDGRCFYPRENLFIDVNVENDKVYGYRIMLSYNVGDRTCTTPGVTVQGIPVFIPDPVHDVSIHMLEDKMFELNWKYSGIQKPEFYYIEAETCPFKEGDLVARDRLEEMMTPVRVERQRTKAIHFKVPEEKICWIIPIVSNQNTAVIGKAQLAYCCKPTEIRRIRSANRRLSIALDWPKDVDKIYVKYGNVRYPVSFDEQDNFQYMFFTKEQYALNDEIFITQPAEREYYFKLYACKYINGKEIYVELAERYYDNRPRQIIEYSIVVHRFRRQAEVIFQSPGWDSFLLKPIDIMMDRGNIPFYREQCIRLLHQEAIKVDKKYSIKISLEDLQKDTYIKPFFADEEDYSRYELLAAADIKYRVK